MDASLLRWRGAFDNRDTYALVVGPLRRRTQRLPAHSERQSTFERFALAAMRAFYRTSRTALHALRRHVMRSVLTCIGIVIGIAAVIAMMEIGQGTSYAVQQTIASLGANQLLVEAGATSSSGIHSGAGTCLTLTP